MYCQFLLYNYKQSSIIYFVLICIYVNIYDYLIISNICYGY